MFFPIFDLSIGFQFFFFQNLFSEALHNIEVRTSAFVATDSSFSCVIQFLFSLFKNTHF